MHETLIVIGVACLPLPHLVWRAGYRAAERRIQEEIRAALGRKAWVFHLPEDVLLRSIKVDGAHLLTQPIPPRMFAPTGVFSLARPVLVRGCVEIRFQYPDGRQGQMSMTKDITP